MRRTPWAAESLEASVSPFFANLAGLPPLLIQVGSQEVFVGEAQTLAARAEAAGVDTHLDVAAGMPHIWHLFASFLPEARQAIDRLGEFFARRARQAASARNGIRFGTDWVR